MAKEKKENSKISRGSDGRFLPGISGNPKGRPRKAAQALHDLQSLLLDAAPGVVARLVIAAVNNGDTTAARILLDNLPHQDSRIVLDNSDKVKLESSSDVLDYSKNIIQLTASGELTVSQGEAMCRLLEKHTRFIEVEQLESRLEALENNPNLSNL